MMYGLSPPVGLGPRFKALIFGLCAALGHPVERSRAPVPLMDQTFLGLRRRLARFLALAARFHAGTLPAARPRDAAPCRRATPAILPREPVPPRRAPIPTPRHAGWLVGLVGYRAAAYRTLLAHFVAEPETLAFLAATPQAGRLLRPLWWMLNRQPFPEALRAPPQSPSAAGGPAAPAAATPEPALYALPGPPPMRRVDACAEVSGLGLLDFE